MQSCPPVSASSQLTPNSQPLHTIPFHTDEHGALVAQLDHPDGTQVKKRRIDRACDACRRKKTRCDGPWTTNNICTNCIQAKKHCSYIESSKPRGPPKAYVVGLEDRVEELEALLAQIRPGVDFSEELGPPIPRDSWKDFDDKHRTKKKSASNAKSTSPAAAGNTVKEASSSVLPTPTALPPLIIPFHQDTPAGLTSPSGKTTHLHFGSQKVRRRRHGTSSASGSSPSIGSQHRSPASVDPSTDSEYETAEESDPDSEEIVESSIAGRSRLTLRTRSGGFEDNTIVFHGRSSTAALVGAARKFKEIHLQESMRMDVTPEEDAANETAAAASVSSMSSERLKVDPPPSSRIAITRRPQFWSTPRWELETAASKPGFSPRTVSATVVARFPPQDLCETLIDLYFSNANKFFPLLHRPTFERQWAEKLQTQDFWFAACCLMVFSVASRWSEDERVLADAHQGPDHPPPLPTRQGENTHDNASDNPSDPSCQEQRNAHGSRWWSAGTPFFESAAGVIRSYGNSIHTASLFEIQTFALMGTFLRATSAHPAAWVIVSTGLRRALDAGAHRKRVYKPYPNAEDELWKRAFWHAVTFDRLGGVTLGRSVGIGEEDFDLDFPLELNDPYWGDEHEWKQPEDVPCTVSAFIHFIKLTQVVAFTSRTVYAINKSKLFSGLIKGDWRTEVIPQLNAALQEWTEQLPAYLRWSEDITDPTLYSLSAALSTSYHLTQITIHRPFIPPPPLLPQAMRDQGPAPSSPILQFPALAICLKSARDCTRILEHQLSKRSWEFIYPPQFADAAFVCAGLFVLALWDFKGQQKAVLKLQTAGVISPVCSGDVEMDEDRKLAVEPDGADIDPDHKLQNLQQKIDKLMVEIKLCIEALEWLEPRWQFTSEMIAKIKASLPEQTDMEVKVPTLPHQLSDDSATKKGSFQDLRRQRKEQKMKKRGHAEETEQPIHPSHPPAFQADDDLPQIKLRRSSSQLRRHADDRSTQAMNTTVFIAEQFPHLHTMTDEDVDGEGQDSRVHRPSRTQFVSSPHESAPSKFLEQAHGARQTYPISPAIPVTQPSPHLSEFPHTDAHRRTPYHQEDVSMSQLSHQHALYDREGYMQTPEGNVPYISGNLSRRPSAQTLAPPPDSQISPYYSQTSSGLTTRTPSFEEFRSDSVPPKFRSSFASASGSRPSMSIDRSPMEEDRKAHFVSPSPSRRYRPDDSAYQERRTPFGPTFGSDIQLRYPWPASNDQNRPHVHHESPAPYSPAATEWKVRPGPQHQQAHPQYHQEPQQHDHPGQNPRYPPAYPHYQQIQLNESSALESPRQPEEPRHHHTMVYPTGPDPATYARSQHSIPYNPANYHSGP